MAKLESASQDIIDLVKSIASELNLTNYVEFVVFNNNKKSKEIVKIQRANEVAEYAFNNDALMVIFEKKMLIIVAMSKIVIYG
jgi:hypothetical protein